MSRRDAFSAFRNPEKLLHEDEEQTPAHLEPRQPLDLIPTASLKRKRSRQWETEHRCETVTYRGIPRSVLADVLGLSKTLSVPRDEVLRAILEYSLSRYQTGELNLIAYPKAQRMTLFPKEVPAPVDPPRGKATRQNWLSDAFPVPEKPSKSIRKIKHTKDSETYSWRVRVTFRIPTLLKEEVRVIAQEHSVAVGEVVWLFVIEGLKAYSTGAFLLNPVPKSIGKTLFQET